MTLVPSIVLRIGEQDLGDLLLADEPLIVSGRIVAQGQWVRGDLSLAVQQARPDGSWYGLAEQRLVVRGDAFAVHGTPPSGPVRLVVESERFLPLAPQPFVAGQKDLEVHLERGGSVEASVLLRPMLGYWCLDALLLPADGRDRVSMSRMGPQTLRMVGFDRAVARAHRNYSERDGGAVEMVYEWPSLWPGRYRLELWAFGSTQPACVVDDVVVPDGGARLRGIDLRQKVRTLTLTVLGADGKPVDSRPTRGFVQIRGAADGAAGFEVNPPPGALAGKVFLLTAAPAVDLEVHVPGYLPRVLEQVSQDATVTLERGPRVEVELRPVPTLPPGHQLRVDLLPAGEPATARGRMMSPAAGGAMSLPSAVRTAVVRDGRAEAVLSRLGRHELRLVVVDEKTRREAPLSGEVAPAEIDVPAGGSSVALRVSQAAVDEALTRLRR